MVEKLTKIVENLKGLNFNESPCNNEMTCAIEELIKFPMTLECLQLSQVAQLLQDIRKRIKDPYFISRIKFLIKCWRDLIQENLEFVVPIELVSKKTEGNNEKSKSNAVMPSAEDAQNDSQCTYEHDTSNGNIINGDSINNEIQHQSNDSEPLENNSDKPIDSHETNNNNHESNAMIDKAPDEIGLDSVNGVTKENELDHTQDKINDELSKKTDTPTFANRPKLKSTLDLMASFSNILDPNLKTKILTNKITYEVDDEEDEEMGLIETNNNQNYKSQRLRDSIKRTVRYADIQQMELQRESSFDTRKLMKISNCERWVKKFQKKCNKDLVIIADPLVSWHNLKKPIDFSNPRIILPKQRKPKIPVLSKKKEKPQIPLFPNTNIAIPIQDPTVYPGAFPEIDLTPKPKPKPAPVKKKVYDVTTDYIGELLDSYEARETRKILAKEERLKRKLEESSKADGEINSKALKMTIKIPQPKLPKIKVKKRRRKKKKKKIIPKIPPPPKVRKPRQPRERPKPPITNYLDIIPTLPQLPENIDEIIEKIVNPEEGEEDKENTKLLHTPEVHQIDQIIHNKIPGINCFQHPQTNEIKEYTEFCSVLIGNEYLHMFPWVDDLFLSKPHYSIQAEEYIEKALGIPEIFS